MIPASFDYLRPATVGEAVAALADEDAKALAGGQSLVPLLRMRLAAPTLMVDLGGIGGLRGVRDDGTDLVIGAMTTYAAALRDPLIARYAPLLARAVATIGDRQVRHLGTVGGGLSHADPAGDLPAVSVALDATMDVAGPGGSRSVPAGEFFVDYLTSALTPGEVLTAVRVPKRESWTGHYEKFNRVAQAWALVGVAALVRCENGAIAEARIALTNMGPTPVRARAVEEALLGTGISTGIGTGIGSPPSGGAATGAVDPGLAGAVAAAAARAAEGTRPTSDVSASAEYRTHLARVLTERAALRALGMPGPDEGRTHAA